MAAKTIYVAKVDLPYWEAFANQVNERGESVSQVLNRLVHAYVEGPENALRASELVGVSD